MPSEAEKRRYIASRSGDTDEGLWEDENWDEEEEDEEEDLGRLGVQSGTVLETSPVIEDGEVIARWEAQMGIASSKIGKDEWDRKIKGLDDQRRQRTASLQKEKEELDLQQQLQHQQQLHQQQQKSSSKKEKDEWDDRMEDRRRRTGSSKFYVDSELQLPGSSFSVHRYEEKQQQQQQQLGGAANAASLQLGVTANARSQKSQQEQRQEQIQQLQQLQQQQLEQLRQEQQRKHRGRSRVKKNSVSTFHFPMGDLLYGDETMLRIARVSSEYMSVLFGC